MKNNVLRMFRSQTLSVAATLSLLALAPFAALAEEISILHVGDQESWLISAQGNLRDNATQNISFFGGIDRLATTINTAATAATLANRSVIKLNAGDALLPGPRLTASFTNLGTAAPDGGQDFYDTIALRQIGFDAIVFGNHEFDLGVPTAARFADVSGATYLSINLDFTKETNLNTLSIAGKVAASKVITTAGGNKIGIIGVTTPLLPTISSPNTLALMNGFAGFSNLNSEAQNLAALLPVIQAEVNRLRAAGPIGDDVDAVIIMSHLQNSNNERTIMVPGLTGVDLVLSGGGHELMADGADLLISGGVAATFSTHPIFADDASAKSVPIVTSHFGNRYVGELRVSIDDNTGVFSVDTLNSKMLRVGTGSAGGGDATLFASVVTPVNNFIAALNAQIIGTTDNRLNGDRAGAGSPRNFAPGIRKSETNLGNLVADSMRFAGEAQVSIQNGGGVRTSIAGPGNVSEGDTFNVLPFTNLVKRAPAMSATQLKAILEHGFGATNTNPSGGEDGRYPQVSGIQVIYDSTRTAGDRVRKLTLTNNTATTADDTLLVDFGTIVNNATFSFATIDFTAAGGDGYPFAANGVVFENSPFTITYQAALSEYITTPVVDGGLGGIVSSVNNPEYGAQNIFDRAGRIIDMIYATTGNDTITGTTGRDQVEAGPGADTITAGLGGDVVTGGTGADTFVFSSLRDAGDTITDFSVGVDVINLAAIFTAARTPGVLGGNISFVAVNGGVSIQITLAGRRTPLAVVQGVTVAQLNNAANFIL